MNSISRRTVLCSSALTIASALPALSLGGCASFGAGRQFAVTDFDGPGQLFGVNQFGSGRTATPRDLTVWLPPGLDQRSAQRRRLLVMQDGRNVFWDKIAFGGFSWRMAEAALRMPGGAETAPVIVAVWNTPARRREYMPTEMANQLPDDLQQRFATANGGPPLSDGYLTFLAEEVLPWARAQWPVSREQRDTVVMGSSMGGLISLAALCRYPGLFSGAGGLSIHWPLLTDAAAYQQGDLQTDRVLQSLDRFAEASLIKPGSGHRIFLDRGSISLDSFYPPYQAHMDATFNRLGWTETSGFKSLVIEGGDHKETSWRTRVDAALAWLFVR